MRFSDRANGLLLAAVGLAVAGYAQTFPPMPGQRIGPSLFPTLIGLGLLLAGGALAMSGLRQRDRPWVSVDSWVRSARAVARMAVVIVALIAYTVVVDRLGFLLTSVLVLSGLFAAFGVRRRAIVPLAIGVTLAMHYGFYTVLRVPLPWGVLEAIAW